MSQLHDVRLYSLPPSPPSQALYHADPAPVAPLKRTPAGITYEEYIKNNRPPIRRGPLAAFAHKCWKLYYSVICASALSTMEPWEQLLTTSVFLSIVLLLSYYFVFHFPSRLNAISERAAYYLYGSSRTMLSKTGAAAASLSARTATITSSFFADHREPVNSTVVLATGNVGTPF